MKYIERIERECASNPEILSITDDDCIRIGDTVLDMTRALGHPYLCATPDVRHFTLEPHHQVIILASDGVWDHLSDEDAIKIALQSEDADSAAESIIAAACGLNKDPKDQDNATVVVVYFDLEG